MTTLRVGEAGATVFDGEGTVLHVLPPGSVVVVGVTEMSGSLADQYQRTKQHATKRLKGYADKRLRPSEDKG